MLRECRKIRIRRTLHTRRTLSGKRLPAEPFEFVRLAVSLPSTMLFDGHGLGQIARLIHIAATPYGDVVGQELQRNDGQDRRE